MDSTHALPPFETKARHEHIKSVLQSLDVIADCIGVVQAYATQLMVVVIGGRTDDQTSDAAPVSRTTSDVVVYDPAVNEWRDVPWIMVTDSERARSHCLVADSTGLLYVLACQRWCGPCDTDLVAILDGYLYYYRTNKDSEQQHMLRWRLNSSPSRPNKCEPNTNKWENITPPPPCIGAYTLLPLLGRLIVPDNNDPHRALHVYDPQQDSWSTTRVVSNTERSGAAWAASRQSLYVCGGAIISALRGTDDSTSCERYCLVTNQWAPIADMSTPRKHARAAYVDGQVLVYGGLTAARDDKGAVVGYRAQRTAEMYNPWTCVWTTVASMPRPHWERWRPGAVVTTTR
jgi:hypothetical protein